MVSLSNPITCEKQENLANFAGYDTITCEMLILPERVLLEISGRSNELRMLDKLYRSADAEFLALYGRRRVGKTFLIRQFFRQKGVYFELTGSRHANLKTQLGNFNVVFSDLFHRGELQDAPGSWQSAFDLLRREIEKIKDQKVILFFDELPWLASPKSGFLEALDHLWNRYLSAQPHVLIVICGSAASWMIKNIINDKGGLHGRITQQIRLLPFTLQETQNYLNQRNIQLDQKQIVEIYMATGGVPKYLRSIERGKSASQVINDLCFSSSGPLFREFNRLYQSLFDDSAEHIKIVKILAKSFYGLKKNDLLKKAGLTSGGGSSAILEELTAAGFIAYIPAFGKNKYGGKYRLIDEYSLFYLTWIDPIPQLGLREIDKDYWLKKQTSSKWKSWSGYAFETIALKHIHKMKEALGISAVSTSESEWSGKGAQVDLVIDREDRCVNLCEIKFYDTDFVITNDYFKKLETKKTCFKEQTGTRKHVFLTIISAFGVKENSNYLKIVDQQMILEQLF